MKRKPRPTTTSAKEDSVNNAGEELKLERSRCDVGLISSAYYYYPCSIRDCEVGEALVE